MSSTAAHRCSATKTAAISASLGIREVLWLAASGAGTSAGTCWAALASRARVAEVRPMLATSPAVKPTLAAKARSDADRPVSASALLFGLPVTADCVLFRWRSRPLDDAPTLPSAIASACAALALRSSFQATTGLGGLWLSGIVACRGELARAGVVQRAKSEAEPEMGKGPFTLFDFGNANDTCFRALCDLGPARPPRPDDDRNPELAPAEDDRLSPCCPSGSEGRTSSRPWPP
mmetsp:Transcript_35186/g.92167  ORF Transcript_35186/g.92167 Transcript_35186/m.92167 type:complete len:234 (-) Transcript_35186:217-918(-)